jgi:hypothetical protein
LTEDELLIPLYRWDELKPATQLSDSFTVKF